MLQNLYQVAQQCLLSTDVKQKVAFANHLHTRFQAGELVTETIDLPDVPDAGRPALPRLVPPSELAQRKFTTAEGRAALLHAVAHIEFNAINLACDAVSRFQDMPKAYYADWLKVAAEEADHFCLVQARLEQLGYAYGDFPAHNGLWEIARQTSDDVLRRMALVPRVMEARGLDVTPGMIKRFAQIKDDETVAVLEVILHDEVGHVEIGSRWFRYLCAQRGLNADEHYLAMLTSQFRGAVRGPLNQPARLNAGFSQYELDQLEALCQKS